MIDVDLVHGSSALFGLLSEERPPRPANIRHHLFLLPIFIEWRVENDYKELAVDGAFYLVWMGHSIL